MCRNRIVDSVERHFSWNYCVKPRENMTCDLPEMMSSHENEGDILKLDQFSQSAVLFDHHLILSVPHLT